MSIYTVLERLEKIEKLLEEDSPVYRIKERLEKTECDIENLSQKLEEISEELNNRMDTIEENIDMDKIKKVLELGKHLNKIKKILGIE